MFRFLRWIRIALILGVVLAPVCPMAAQAADQQEMTAPQMDCMHASSEHTRIAQPAAPCCAMQSSQDHAAERVATVRVASVICARLVSLDISSDTHSGASRVLEEPKPQTSPPFNERSQNRLE
jgi:hypothetical protein